MLTDVQQRRLPAAIVRTLNLTAQQTRNAVAKDLSKEMGETTGLSRTGFKKAIRLLKAKRSLLVATLVAGGSAIPLLQFGARQVRVGVSAAPMAKRRTFKGAFISRMPSGHRGVFRRRTRQRLPIREMFGPPIPKVFLSGPILRAMRTVASQRWRINFDRELRRILHRP